MDTKEIKGGIDKVVLRPPGNAAIEKFEHTGPLSIERSYNISGEAGRTERRKRGLFDKIFQKDETKEPSSDGNKLTGAITQGLSVENYQRYCFHK